MKAAVYTKYGPPELVQIQDIPIPVPKENEVLVNVHVSTVNRTDCGFRSAQYFVSRFFSGLMRPKFKTLGNEFAGVVETIGSNVSLFKPGDKVFGYNDEQFGAHAEFMIMSENKAITLIPRNFNFEESAPLSEGAHYALGNIRAAKVKAGDHVLVYGATGAIGSAAVQLLKVFKAHVTAVCDSKGVDLVKSLGAEVVFDYTKEDFTKTNQKYEFIFDSVGKSSFGACKPLLKEKGIYISTELGKNGENIFLALYTPLFNKKKLLFPIPSIKKDDIEFLKDLAEKGMFKPVIDRAYELENIVEAYNYVETGTKTGNVLLKIN